MGMKISMGLGSFKAQLNAERDKLHRATRPAAQAGAQIVYDRAKLLAPESDSSHKFYGTHGVYGPYAPGNLRNSIYQVFSQDKSYKDVSTYHISWNKDEAPYGFMVEFGTSRSPAQSFIGRAVVETRSEVRAAIKARYIQEVQGKA